MYVVVLFIDFVHNFRNTSQMPERYNALKY
jgi:hypothetical protein